MGKQRLKLRSSDNSLEMRKRYAGGNDPAALLQMIYIACVMGCPLPHWVCKGFIASYQKGSRGELKSWDEAFGRPPTAQEYLRFSREEAKRDKIWNMVATAKAKGPGIGNSLFEEIGDRPKQN